VEFKPELQVYPYPCRALIKTFNLGRQEANTGVAKAWHC